jgi:hypothetical protein
MPRSIHVTDEKGKTTLLSTSSSLAATNMDSASGSETTMSDEAVALRLQEIVWLMYKVVSLFVDGNNNSLGSGSFRPLPAFQILFGCMSSRLTDVANEGGDVKRKIEFISLVHMFLAK